jgi:hypothetical protein
LFRIEKKRAQARFFFVSTFHFGLGCRRGIVVIVVEVDRGPASARLFFGCGLARCLLSTPKRLLGGVELLK